jgi:hypothetical protein
MMIDGAVDDAFLALGPGVLALEDPAPGQVTFYPEGGQPAVSPRILVARNRWGNLLSGQETLHGLTLIQDVEADPYRNFVMVATSTGKVLGYQIDYFSLRGSAFNTGLSLKPALTSIAGCAIPFPAGSLAPVKYDLRASARTRRTFFVAGSCVGAYDADFSGPVPVRFPTRQFETTTDFALTSVTVSPGIEIDFIRDGCIKPGSCNVIVNNGEVAARLFDLELDPQVTMEKKSGWLVYQIKGLPDCRYVDHPLCSVEGVVQPAPPPQDPTQPYDPGDPTQQYLNITKLLPPEITDTVPVCTALNGLQPPTCLPAMWLQPEYRARRRIPEDPQLPPVYTFDALFGIPEPGLIYRNTFNAEFDIGDLFGDPAAKLGCGMHDPDRGPLLGREAPPWDVVVNISELAPTVGGPTPGAAQYVSVLVNYECNNPTRLIGGRGSAFLYGLERAPNVVGTTTDGWYDSTFALLMRSLARDYDANLYRYACAAGDPNDVAPINAASCYELKKAWPVTYDKLLKCVGATDQPKSSAGNEACTSFKKQFEAYKVIALVDANLLKDAAALDRYNRVGEFLARTWVLSYVYYKQFEPSIKAGGFVDPN